MVQWVFSIRSLSGFPVSALSAMLGCGDGGDLCAGHLGLYVCVSCVVSCVGSSVGVGVPRSCSK